MTLRKTIEQQIQENSDYKKQHEFFVVEPAIGTFQKSKSYQERENGWLKLCQETSLPLTSYYVEGAEGSEKVVLRFRNGLEISSSGYQVAFSAIGEKSEVDMNSALSVVGCSANHLYRRGWGPDVNISTIREGAAPMVKRFEESHKQARQIVNAEILQRQKGFSY